MKKIETVGQVNVYQMKEDFGNIYAGNNPSWGVYREDALVQHGSHATAVSHHWTEVAAFSCARNQNILERVAHAVVKFI